VTVIIVSLGADVSLAQRQSGLGAFEGLALALFIAAEYQGLLWRIEIKAHHVPELFLKPKVLGELEAAHPVGLQIVGRPESLHARFAQAGFAGHRAHAPRPALRSLRARQTQGPPDSLGRKPRLASTSRGVLEPHQALGRPSLPPTTNGQKTHRLLFCDLLVGESPRQPQDDPSPENLSLTAAFRVHDTHKLSLLTGAHFNPNRCWHGRHPTISDASIQSHLWDITLASPRSALSKERARREVVGDFCDGEAVSSEIERAGFVVFIVW
jgi:hypothetical protein